jgi:galactitol-specific phosphotransferase system IIB component
VKNIGTFRKSAGRKKVKILCSSRTGVASCSQIAGEIKKFLSKNHIDFEIIECMSSDINSLCTDVDLIISMTQLPPVRGRPVISGVPFITGNKLEDTKKEILKILKN